MLVVCFGGVKELEEALNGVGRRGREGGGERGGDGCERGRVARVERAREGMLRYVREAREDAGEESGPNCAMGGLVGRGRGEAGVVRVDLAVLGEVGEGVVCCGGHGWEAGGKC